MLLLLPNKQPLTIQILRPNIRLVIENQEMTSVLLQLNDNRLKIIILCDHGRLNKNNYNNEIDTVSQVSLKVRSRRKENKTKTLQRSKKDQITPHYAPKQQPTTVFTAHHPTLHKSTCTIQSPLFKSSKNNNKKNSNHSYHSKRSLFLSLNFSQNLCPPP